MTRSLLAMALACAVTACAPMQKKSDSETPPPKLLKPDVKKIWIPPEIRNGGQEWIEGHYMYRIERNTTWSR